MPILTEDLLFINTGLYEPIQINEDNYDDVFRLLIDHNGIQFDCYCPECSKDSTFRTEASYHGGCFQSLSMTPYLNKFANIFVSLGSNYIPTIA